MAWIESHQSLGDHPKTLRAAQMLRIDVAQMVGHLHFLWWWALDYAQNGDISALTPAEIAHAARWKRDASHKARNPEEFVAALETCGRPGFIERDGDGLQIHDWQEYAGKLLDRRRKDAERKRGGRSDVQRTSSGRPALPATDGVRTVPYQPSPNQPNQPSAAAEGPRDGDDGFRQVTDSLTRLGARLNPLAYDDIGGLLDEGYRPEWFALACMKAAENSATSWAYVRKVLTGWGLDGPPPPRERSNGNGRTRTGVVQQRPDDEDPIEKRLRLDAEREARQLGVS